MNISVALFAVVSLTLLAGVVFELVRTLRGDGQGHRALPDTSDWAAPSAPTAPTAPSALPSHPYRD